MIPKAVRVRGEPKCGVRVEAGEWGAGPESPVPAPHTPHLPPSSLFRVRKTKTKPSGERHGRATRKAPAASTTRLQEQPERALRFTDSLCCLGEPSDDSSDQGAPRINPISELKNSRSRSLTSVGS
jgi:hypothetical protein